MPTPEQQRRGTRDADAHRDMTNGKPYRTQAQKIEARRLARKDKDGTWRSSAPVSHHRPVPA